MATACAAFTAVPSSGQTTLGLRGGATVSSFGGDDADVSDSYSGYHVGAAASFALSDIAAVEIGVSIVQKGATQNVGGIDALFQLDYIEVPVLVKLGVPTAGRVSPHFFVGPTVAFETACDAEGEVQGLTVTAECSELGVETRSTDVGAIVGAGIDVATSGAVSLRLDVLYDVGLTALDESVAELDVKNRTWSFLAGVGFALGG